MMTKVLFYGLPLLCLFLAIDSDNRGQAKILHEGNEGMVLNGSNLLYPSAEATSHIRHSAVYYLGKDQYVYHGAKVTMIVYGSPNIQQNQISTSAIWLTNWVPGGELNELVLGWHVHPNLYGDTKTHFFALWTTDGYKKTICYNHGCPTFVSLNPSEFGLGSVIEKVSTYNGEQVDITIKIRRDKASGNWWLSYGPSGSHRDLIPIGYWKGSIFTGLADNASIILWGGRTSYAENMKGPPMGSGHFSTEGYGKAAGFTDITAIDVDGKYYDPDKMIGFMDRPDCYDISELRKSKFFYGGPAGCSK